MAKKRKHANSLANLVPGKGKAVPIQLEQCDDTRSLRPAAEATQKEMVQTRDAKAQLEKRATLVLLDL